MRWMGRGGGREPANINKVSLVTTYYHGFLAAPVLVGDLDAGEIALDHLPEHVFLVPVRDEDGGLGNRAGLLVQPRGAIARDAHREEIDERVVERRHRNEQADEEQRNDQQVSQDRLVRQCSSAMPRSSARRGHWYQDGRCQKSVVVRSYE